MAAVTQATIVRSVTALLVTAGSLAVPAAVISMLYAGVGWDARMDAGQSLVIREVIPALPPGTTLETAYEMVFFTAEFYGILVPQLGDVLNTLLTGSSELLQLNSIATYRWQGLANILLATSAAASLAVAVKVSLKSNLAGSFVWALLMFTPTFFGMSYVNIKDMPVAVGFTLISSGYVLNRAGTQRSVRWGFGPLLVVVGSCVALATRPGLWPLLLGFAGLVLLPLLVLDTRAGRLSRSLPAMCSTLVGAAVSVLFVWWTNPLARLGLFQWLGDAFFIMRNYPWDAPIRVAGQDVLSTDLPWWYVPAWLAAQLPILTILTILAAAVIGVLALSRARPERPYVVSLYPLVAQAVLLPTAVVLTGATLYDGIRHVFFLVPALIGLSGIAVALLEQGTWRPNVFNAASVAVVALLVVLTSAWATFRWVPYSYAFINPLAGINHPQRDWELDFWGVTAFEGVDRLKQMGLRDIAVQPTEETATLFGGGSLEAVQSIGSTDGYGLYVFKRWNLGVGDCTRLFAIERDRQILGEGAWCR